MTTRVRAILAASLVLVVSGLYFDIVSDFSEEGGFFRSENLVSNESSFQDVIPELKRQTNPEGVYLGVGPEQNFTYIAALRPKLAFIIDIRRQNMLEQLMYKAIMEISPTRADFLSMLFARPIPEHLNAHFDLALALRAFAKTEPSQVLFEENLQRILERLTRQHGFALAPEDPGTIRRVYQAFFTGGPEIRYSFPNSWSWRRFPSYSELMLETDRNGIHHSYLAKEENYQFLRGLQSENRIVPIVGDFAGDTAIHAVGSYLRKHNATVTAFYTSNVEFYLFQSEDWRKFFRNVSKLPLNDQSTFIRAYFNNSGVRGPGQHSGTRSETLLDKMTAFVEDFESGRIRSYYDLIDRSY
jgi:hypothetical protein